MSASSNTTPLAKPVPASLSTASTSWVVHKFGGTSLAAAACYANAVDIIFDIDSKHRRCVVVSAMGEIKANSDVSRLMEADKQKRGDTTTPFATSDKVTNLLIKATELAAKNDTSYLTYLSQLKARHNDVCDQLLNEAEWTGKPHYSSVLEELRIRKAKLIGDLHQDLDDLSYILRATWLSKQYDLEHNWWFGYGEIWSARLIATYLNIRNLAARADYTFAHGGDGSAYINQDAVWLDARQVVYLARNNDNVPDFDVSQKKFDAVNNGNRPVVAFLAILRVGKRRMLFPPVCCCFLAFVSLTCSIVAWCLCVCVAVPILRSGCNRLRRSRRPRSSFAR